MGTVEEINCLQCEDCGMYSKKVWNTFCPYAQDINDISVPITVCPDCFEERAMER
jgi:hypothetical protein